MKVIKIFEVDVKALRAEIATLKSTLKDAHALLTAVVADEAACCGLTGTYNAIHAWLSAQSNVAAETRPQSKGGEGPQ